MTLAGFCVVVELDRDRRRLQASPIEETDSVAHPSGFGSAQSGCRRGRCRCPLQGDHRDDENHQNPARKGEPALTFQ